MPMFGRITASSSPKLGSDFNPDEGPKLSSTSNLLAEKNGLHKTYMNLRTDATNAAFFKCSRLVQQRLREMQDTWMIRKAEELQRATNNNCPTPTTSVASFDYLPLGTSNTTAAPSTCDGDLVLTCPNCDRTFTSHVRMVGHLLIHRTETGELVPGAQTHNRDRGLQCPHGPRAFTHHMRLLGHMRIHDWWYGQGWLRTHQPPASSSASGLLDSVMTPDPSGGGGENAVDEAETYYYLKLILAQITVTAPPFRGAYGGHSRTTTDELSDLAGATVVIKEEVEEEEEEEEKEEQETKRQSHTCVKANLIIGGSDNKRFPREINFNKASGGNTH
ncbi:unnamed protein product [Schistocephalus solidus]|uniref:C2H2-type domain-containing protein n=1 Tax=Schistocephalus solidus TaxID=70667 RepID=A0A183SYV8_SCHSO|nr:unnamed protein product [Schistocephalus solidus]